MKRMSVALPEQLNFEKSMPFDGNCKQQIAFAQPITGSGSYTLGSYFIINIPRCGPEYVFDPMNSFLRFNVYNADGTGVLNWDHSVNSILAESRYCTAEMYWKQSTTNLSSQLFLSIAK